MNLSVETFRVGPLDNNLYLLCDEAAGEGVVIDPSIDSGPALERVQQWQAEGIRLRAIWNTHGHFDHVHDNALWRRAFDVPVWMHQADEWFLGRLREQSLWMGLPAPEAVPVNHHFAAGQTLRVGAHACRVLHTPGHSPGSVSFVFDEAGLCISGDVLFRNSIGRTDLPLCDAALLRASLQTLTALPPATRVLPGHGEETTIAHELATNPYCRLPFQSLQEPR